MMEVLLDHQNDLPITEGVLIAAASAQPNLNRRITIHDKWKTVLEVLLRPRPDIHMSEKVVWTVATN
jgi:hypothetical protein